MPILQNLYDMLKNQEEKVGKKLATEMEIYVTGSLNVFNHQSNVDLNKQLLSSYFVLILRSLEVSLKKSECLLFRIRCGTRYRKTEEIRLQGTILTSFTCF